MSKNVYGNYVMNNDTYTAKEVEALIANATNYMLERFKNLVEVVQDLDDEIRILRRGEHLFYDVIAIEDNCDEFDTGEKLLASSYPGLTQVALEKQRQYCEVTLDGIPAVNGPVEQGGDYILNTLADGTLSICFHDVVTGGSIVTIRAYRT